jgi:Flp pilus assembly protein TadG
MRCFGSKKFWKDKKGLAAVEFAFVAPVMLSMFFGLVELCQALSCRADVTNMASTGSDLIAQEKAVTDADLSNVGNALSAMLYPFDPSKAVITIYSITDNSTVAGKVAWSRTCTGPCSSWTAGPTTAPTGSTGGTIIASSNNGAYGSTGSVILTQITYTYTSPLSYFLVGNYTMTNMFYSKPRRVTQITYSAT